MADNTEQFEFIQAVQGNLDALLSDFVAGDHLWYPVEGRPTIRVAPDVYVALGRPKGHRGSYKQWEEHDVPLSVVFEWWSPNSTFVERVRKLRFYERYGVQEFYSWGQVERDFAAFIRKNDELLPVDTSEGWRSPLLGIRFEADHGALRIFHPDGKPFLTFREQVAQADEATTRAEALAAKLRELGVDPDEILGSP